MRNLLSFLNLRPAGFLPSQAGATAKVAIQSRAPHEERQPLEENVVELSPEDLPAVCPNSRMPLWSSHPRVFLDVVNEREAMCPYCGTRYHLRPGARIHDHHFGTPNMHQHRESPALKSP